MLQKPILLCLLFLFLAIVQNDLLAQNISNCPAYAIDEKRNNEVYRVTNASTTPGTNSFTYVGDFQSAGEPNDLIIMGNLIYATNELGYLEVWDINNPGVAATQVGPAFGSGNGSLGLINFTVVNSITLTLDNEVIAVAEDTDLDRVVLFKINLTTGTFISDAFGAGNDYLPITLTPADASLWTIPTPGTEDLAINPCDGSAYLTTRLELISDGSFSDHILSIDLATGVATEIADIVEHADGLAFDFDGNLFSTDDDDFYLIDPNTGTLTFLDNIANMGNPDFEAFDMCVNRAPIAINDTVTMDVCVQDTLVVNVLVNDYDNEANLDQTSVTIDATSLPTGFTASADTLGNVTIMADPAFMGAAAIAYSVSDDFAGNCSGALSDTAYIIIINYVNCITCGVTQTRDTAICEGQTVNLDNLITEQIGMVRYSLSNGNWGSILSTVTPIATTTYFVQDSNIMDNCVDTALIIIQVDACDWGDLPDISVATAPNDYQTLAATNGPVHVIRSDLRLGSLIDGELDGVSSANALGDGVDEDGVTIFSSLDIRPEGTIRLPFHYVNSTGNTAYLEGWIDWNGDGDFNDANEMIIDTDDSSGSFLTPLEINIPVIAATDIQLGFRMRLSLQDNMTPYGKIDNGEIEDYLIEVHCRKYCLPISVNTN